MSFLDLKLNNINYQLGVLTAQSGLVNVANTQASSVFYPMFCPTFGSIQPVSINQSGLTYRANTDTLTSTGLISSSLSSATIITSKITGEQSFSLNAATGMSVGLPNTAIGISLTTPNANNFSVGQKVIVQGNANAYFNGVEYTITQINSSYILQTNNPTSIPALEVGGGGTVSGGIITTRDLTATNLNGKLNVAGGTSNSGNLLFCNNTTSTTGNFDLLTDSNQYLRYAGSSNLLTIGGSTNGGIAIPGTAGSIVCNTYASNASTKMTLNTKNGTIELQNNGTKIGDILYANASYPLQILGTGGVSIDSGTNTDLNISAGRASTGRTINFFTAGVVRGAIKDAGAAFDTYIAYSGGNLTITSYTGAGNPGIIFNANAYNNNALSGNYGYINAGGWYFNDGNSSGATQSCGVNNVGFYVPNAGYFINGSRYNAFFGSLYNASDIVIYNNAGAGIAFNVLGTGAVYSNGGRLTNVNPSDRTLKENITPFKSQLENILKLKPVSYNWIDRLRNGDKLYNGFIAQDAQEIDDISELVSTFKDVFDNEKLGFDMVGLVPFIVKAIQEQNQIVKDQQKQIEDQQKQIDDLKLLVNSIINKPL
jgi:hypothetical protein